MKIKDKIYYFFVDRKPEIKREYEGYISRNLGVHHKHRLRSWVYLFGLHLVYFGKKGGGAQPRYGNNLNYPEMGIEPRMPVEELVAELETYDVISFDIFDTLVLRGISDPRNLFVLIGNRLKVTGFKVLRVNAEADARNNHPEINGEITIEDIYELLERRCGISRERGIQTELEAELDICFANPYMLETARRLQEKGKRIIATSNMYWDSGAIRKILDACGFTFINEIFVSCEFKCSKYKGALQEKVWDVIGRENTVIHVGDNYTVDFVGSRMAGWKAFYYKNVNEIGRPYRPAGMSDLGGSVYSGLVNAKFHHGLLEQRPYFELGYAYGGPLVAGFCHWINEYAENHHIDKLLFTGRDMYCVHRIYNKFYAKYDNDYIAISRFAAQRFAYRGFSEYFIDSHIKARAGIEKLSIREALEELDINCLYPFLKDFGLEESQLLDPSVFPELKQCMEEHKGELLNEFEGEKKAAIQYYSQFVEKNQRIAVIDLGWQGTNALCLKYLLENETDYGVELFSLLVCLTGRRTFADHCYSGKVVEAYCASPRHNRQMLYHFSQPSSIGRFICELIFSSPEDSLRQFTFDKQGKVKLLYNGNEKRKEGVFSEIFAGIFEFMTDYMNLGFTGEEIAFSGFEALLPLNKLFYNLPYCLEILSGNPVNPWIGITKSEAALDIEKIVR